MINGTTREISFFLQKEKKTNYFLTIHKYDLIKSKSFLERFRISILPPESLNLHLFEYYFLYIRNFSRSIIVPSRFIVN